MEIETIRDETTVLKCCPVWITDRGDDVSPCDAELIVQATMTIRGDEYGDWPVFSVYFRCGHSLEDMARSLQNEV